MRTMLLSAVFLAQILACGSTGKEDTAIADPFEDADGDTDADADADADSDADADTDPPPYLGMSLHGAVDYQSWTNDTVDCDTEITLDGFAYVGPCENCTFAFRVEGEVAAENGTDDCVPDTFGSLVPGVPYADLILAHSTESSVTQGGLDFKLYDVFQVGFSYTYYYEGEAYFYPGPYWWQMAYEGDNKDSSFVQDGDEVAWSLAMSAVAAEYGDEQYLNGCGESLAEDTDSSGALGGDSTGSSDVLCEGFLVDVWEFEGSAGGNVSVTVDTIAEETRFDAAFWVNKPNGCFLNYANDTFDCTYPPSAGKCPASQFQVTEGTHEIVVFSWGSCATQYPEYTISLDASWDPDLTLKTDNADRYLEQTLTFSSFEANGCGILYDDGIPDEAVRCEPAPADGAGESEGD
jgi:hypothetical protein